MELYLSLRRGRTLKIRALAFSGALVSFVYIVSVALMRTPLPFIR